MFACKSKESLKASHHIQNQNISENKGTHSQCHVASSTLGKSILPTQGMELRKPRVSRLPQLPQFRTYLRGTPTV